TEPSRAARILGLCKIGLVLRYFAPQISEAAAELGALLSKWLPRIEAASGRDAYYRVLADLAAQLPDRHAGIIAPALESSSVISRPSKPMVLGSVWLGHLHYLRALPDNLVYMRPFAMPDVAALRAAFALIQNTRGLLLDLRGYPQTHFQHDLVRCLCDWPVASPRYEIPIVSGPDVSQRTWQVVQHTVRPDGRVVYLQPVVALIDATTQSSAEDFGMYLKIAGRVTFVGQRTAGCVGNATYVNLPGGGRLTFTGMRVTWPDGRPVWGIGLVPDVNVAVHADVFDTGLEVLQTLSVHEYARD
ncbi:MAG: hypothetical protein KA765_13310, partial [Thermoflexales bacterium]|nr:hypothetical protein [Thermoflexales bacterium]